MAKSKTGSVAKSKAVKVESGATREKHAQMANLAKSYAAEGGRTAPTAEDLARTARSFAVSVATIKKACKAHGCDWQRRKRGRISENRTMWLPVIAAILRGETLEEAGKAGGVSKQWASHIRNAMIDTGIFEAAEQYVLRQLPPDD